MKTYVCNVEQEKRLQEGVYPKHYCINFLILLYQIIFTYVPGTRYVGRIYLFRLFICTGTLK
jgi:hypothetical protein